MLCSSARWCDRIGASERFLAANAAALSGARQWTACTALSAGPILAFMPKRPPEPPRPAPSLLWDIYRAASKAKWTGSVEAADADAAVQAAAIEFKTDARKLIAVRRRWTRWQT